MGAYFVKQPNGLYARFSTVVDNFTHFHLDADGVRRQLIDEAVALALQSAKVMLATADEDKVPGTGRLYPTRGRWVDCLGVIARVHGTKTHDEMLAEYEEEKP